MISFILFIVAIFIIVSLVKAHFVFFIIGLIAFIAIAVMKHLATVKMKQEHGIAENAIKINYYGQYSKKLSNKIYYWKESHGICFGDPKTNINIRINKENITSYNTMGDVTRSQKITGGEVKGGGVSLGGAAVGGAIAGPVGAIIGGRKKVKSKPIKTETVTTDTRKVVLNFLEHGENEQMVVHYCVYKDLSELCPEKNGDTHDFSSPIDIPEQIKKLSNLKNQGVLTEEEFNKKKNELLAKM